jgi:hypothetical protein
MGASERAMSKTYMLMWVERSIVLIDDSTVGSEF